MIAIAQNYSSFCQRGFYDLLIGFVLVVVLIAAVLLFIMVSRRSTMLHAQIRLASQAYDDAMNVHQALFTCHGGVALKLDEMYSPCPAKSMGRGFIVTRLNNDRCPELSWDFSTGQYSQTIPFIINIRQSDGTMCLGKLEVLMP